MRRLLVFLLILTAAATAVTAQRPSLVDPNITRLPGVTAEETSTTGDERLDRKMTYDGGYKRLDTVISDLSSMSGVNIYCGKNSGDWQVQDIPVTVYVKDIPLGKLLRAIADATHTMLTSTTVSSDSDEQDKEPSYRICRNNKSVDSIVALMEARYYAKYADAEWGWDSLSAFGSDPGLDSSNIGSWASGFSKVLAYLGEEGKRKVFSGEKVVVNTQTAPQIADALRELYKQHASADCLSEDLDKSEMTVKLSAVGDSGLMYLIGDWTWHKTDGRSSSSGYPISRCATALRNVKGFSLPPRPQSELPTPEDDCPKDRLRLLNTPEDWNLPVLKTGIDLKAPADNSRPSYSDAVVAIARARGFNIVCEDFRSHQAPKYNPRPDQFFAKDTTVADALRKLGCYTPKWLNNESGDYDPVWMINEQDKLIVGWASNWREHHYYLAPESLITGLCEKMNGSGALLDDVLPLLDFPPRQLSEWISHTEDISSADCWSYTTDRDAEYAAWRLYAALDGQDRAQVRSKSGLPLGKFDPKWLVSFFSRWSNMEPRYDMLEEEKQRAEADIQLKRVLLTDPELLSRLVMRIPEHWLEHNIVLTGEKVVAEFRGPRVPFPLYSPKRADELKVGKPARVWGYVHQVGDRYLYLDNGPGIKDGTKTGGQANIGLRVICDPSGYKRGDQIEVEGKYTMFTASAGREVLCIDASDEGQLKKRQ